MFNQQVLAETVPSVAQDAVPESLNDCAQARRLLEQHTGFSQFRLVLPDRVILSAEAARIRGASGPVEMTLGEAIRAYLPADRKRIVDTISEAIRDRRGFHITARRQVGDITRVIESFGDVKVENGVLTEIFGLTRDISEKVEHEALGISRARLIRRMVEDMPVPVVVLDRALRVVACSSAWAKSYGLEHRTDALGRPVNELAEMSRETSAAIIEAMHGQAAQVSLPFYGAEDGRQVMRTCVVVPWQCGTDAAGGVLMLVGEERPPYATLEIADRALGRSTRGLMDMLEAM
jgi:PAS domain-containing protein